MNKILILDIELNMFFFYKAIFFYNILILIKKINKLKLENNSKVIVSNFNYNVIDNDAWNGGTSIVFFGKINPTEVF